MRSRSGPAYVKSVNQLCYNLRLRGFVAKRGIMESKGSSGRGVVVLVVVLAVSALLGGLYGPSVRATAAGQNDTQDSVKSFTHVLSVVERNYAEPVDTDK